MKEGEYQMDDVELVNLYFDRDESAIKITNMKYGKLCRYVIGNIISINEDKDECVNDTYLTMWNSIPPTRPHNFSAYISKIARNIALKKYEYLTAGKRNYNMSVSLDELEDCVNGKASLEGVLEGTRIEDAITRFLYKQSKLERIIFVKRYWYFDSINDIAKCFNMNENSVASILFRTRNKLRKFLMKEGIEL